ncbi:MAG: glycosyltransferase, partial [Acidobacteriota bacterium]|nr:glycosyltransferase [Acidobacteriota bacterium]
VMFVSIIICTYRRAEALGDLLDCLAVQTYRDSEILIVDGSGEDLSVRNKVESFMNQRGERMSMRLIQSQKGLTRQRNVGLREAQGELICFFDDDVTFGEDFISQVVGLFQQRDMKNVGGATAYDVLNYGVPMRFRHKLRGAAGFYTSWRPGALARCGLVVPLDIQPAFSGCMDVGWLGGFCMLYRREAIANLYFDEGLPTYGGEDTNFSMKVGKKWRLVLCGDLQLKHHRTVTSRVNGAAQVYDTSYGAARNQLSESMTFAGVMWLVWFAILEFVFDAVSFIRRPSWMTFNIIRARQRGLIAGIRSIYTMRQDTPLESNLVVAKKNAER